VFADIGRSTYLRMAVPLFSSGMIFVPVGSVARTLATSAVQELPATTDLELVFAASAPTALKRFSLYESVRWLPTATEQRNPLTLYGARDVDRKVRANAPTASAGIPLSVVHGLVFPLVSK
jgi:hypothetical protein